MMINFHSHKIFNKYKWEVLSLLLSIENKLIIFPLTTYLKRTIKRLTISYINQRTFITFLQLV